MVEMLMSVALAFGITFYAIPVIIQVSKEKRLFDLPDERKIHQIPVPSMGGLGIFAGFIIAFILTINFGQGIQGFQYLVAAMLILFFVGIKDDLTNITPLKKFLGQVLAAHLLILKGGFVITDMNGILGVNELPDVGSYAISMITFVVIINAYNLIDGVDGLCGTLSVFSALAFAVFFAVNGQMAFACMATSILGALSAFLIFNFSPARIFMGDTGSLILGLLNAVMVIQFINMNTAPQSYQLSFNSAPAIGFAILFVPLFDTLRVFTLRIIHGQSPFTPDKNHIHHILLRFGLTHKEVVFWLVSANVLVTTVAVAAQNWGGNWVLALVLSIGFALVFTMVKIYNTIQNKGRQSDASGANLPKGKVRFITYISKEAASNN